MKKHVRIRVFNIYLIACTPVLNWTYKQKEHEKKGEILIANWSYYSYKWTVFDAYLHVILRGKYWAGPYHPYTHG